MKNHYSVKTILRKDKKRKDDTYPLNFLIIFNSKTLKLPALAKLQSTIKGNNTFTIQSYKSAKCARCKETQLDRSTS